MKKRIGISYKTQRSGLIWLDDKVKQAPSRESCCELVMYFKGDFLDFAHRDREALARHIEIG